MIRPHDIEADVWAAITSAAAGDGPVLRSLIERDRRLSRCEYWYRPTIHFAVRAGHVEAVNVLLEGDADPEWNGYHSGSLVDMARDRGFEDVARLLEQARERRGRLPPALVDHPIHTAAQADDTMQVRKLLDADPMLINRGGRGGSSPLHRAVVGGARDAVALLLDRGADIHTFHGTGLGAPAGWWAQDVQAIDLAVWGGPPGLGPPRSDRRHAQIATQLLERGAASSLTVAAALGDLKRITAILDKDPGAVREAPGNGRRPLSAAVEFGRGDVARLLLDRGADPNWPELGSPTGSSLQRAAGAGDRELVELLLERGANPNSSVDSGGNATFAAKTPELRALLRAHGGTIDLADLTWLADDDEVVRSVEQDPRAAERDCGTLFAFVSTNKRRDLLVRLLRTGLRVPEVVTSCQSYLMDDLEMLGLLLESGMNPDTQNWQGQTLLHHLSAGAQPTENRVQCAAMLLDAGASMSVRDAEYRSTPLGWAARAGVRNMVEFLLARGAVTALPDDEPWATPLAWARRKGHAGIVEMLRSAGASA